MSDFVRAAGPPDPNCERGLFARGACCEKICEQCGGKGCFERSKQFNTRCCPSGIKNPASDVPWCSDAGPPCRVKTGVASEPNDQPKHQTTLDVPGEKGKNYTLSGVWKESSVVSGTLERRHEACAVMVNGLVVLIGGRGVNKTTNVYNPLTATWESRSGPGLNVELHHMQCVSAAGNVWIVSSWKGEYPRESNNDLVYVYNVKNDSWSTRPGMPEHRKRGAAAAVLKGSFIYVVGGNRGGHGEHATSLTWMDAFNWRTGRWSTKSFPDLPGAGRDHVGGALVNGQLCISGGRDGGTADFFNAVNPSTYCYSFRRRKWIQKMDLPYGRAGAATGTACDGRMVLAGGEGNGTAYARVDVFDGSKWTQAPNLLQARHGSGLAVARCSCGHIFIPSGSGNQGGGPELLSTEQYFPQQGQAPCLRY